MNIKSFTGMAAVAGILAVAGAAVPAHAATLDDVKSAGVLKCGINTGLAGFAFTGDLDSLIGAEHWRD